MKQLILVFLCVAIGLSLNAQTGEAESVDIKTLPSFKSKLEVQGGSKIEKGTLYRSKGSAVEGYLVYENTYLGRPDFRKPKTLRFGSEKNGRIDVQTLKYADLDSMRIGDNLFHVMDVNLGAKLKNAIVERVKEYEKTDLIIVTPPFLRARGLYGSNDTDLEAELVVFHKKKKKIMRTTGLFGFNKAMKKIIKGCSKAEKYLKSVKSKRKKKSIFKRLEGFDNRGVIEEALKLYDRCK